MSIPCLTIFRSWVRKWICGRQWVELEEWSWGEDKEKVAENTGEYRVCRSGRDV